LPASDGRNSGLDKFIDSAPKWWLPEKSS
jgi:hypothetical protein